MEDEHKREIALTESLFREVNEAVAQSAERFEAEEAAFLCECAEAGCAERVTAELDDYERVRANATRFLIVPGHQRSEVEQVVDRRPDLYIVEKVDRAAADTARRLDPRAAPRSGAA